MPERKMDLLFLVLLLLLIVTFFSQILFTEKIIRAPDILNEFYWGIKDAHKASVLDAFRFDLRANWDLYNNSGDTTEGGWVGARFLVHHAILFALLPPPSSIAWFIVLYLFMGAAGSYIYCRTVGVSRSAAIICGLVFAMAPENASLINAGHVLKIASICYAPWVFYFFEKGILTRRLIFFLSTALVLAFQFFAGHWQIAYYTCLCLAVYALIRIVNVWRSERPVTLGNMGKLITLNIVTVLFFLTTVAISLFPLASWSIDTNRGATSGANQGKGGLEIEEAMSWSLPPEELVSFVIPGFFGFSRQEGGANPTNIPSYYWGRMHFTQTTDYMGLLPWLLVPLPLVFRRDRYTVLALTGIIGGLLFSMGKYTPFYQFLYDYFPGINRFRVPKMIMYIPVMSLGFLAARGLDCLMDEGVRQSRGFRRYLAGIVALPVTILLLLGVEKWGETYWINRFIDLIGQPNRYEQGPLLVAQRWNNLVQETGIAAVVAALHAAALLAVSRRWFPLKAVPVLLCCLYLADVGRVNAKFMFLVDVPEKAKAAKTPVIEFLAGQSKEYRVLPVSADPQQFATNNIPILFTSHPVQQVRWQDYLDNFSFGSALPDILNVRYLIYGQQQFLQEQGSLPPWYRPVFESPDKSEVVVENLRVLPKGWLVPSVILLQEPQQAFAYLANQGFDPRRVALVEKPPPLPMAGLSDPVPVPPGSVRVLRYEGERIELQAETAMNSLLVLGEKYAKGWKTTVDGKAAETVPVNYMLRGVYLTPGSHKVEFDFDPISFKAGKYLTLSSFALFAAVWGRYLMTARRRETR